MVVINLITCDYHYCSYRDLRSLVRMCVCSWFASDVILCMHYFKNWVSCSIDYKTPAITISPGAEGCNLVPRALHLFLLSLRPRVFVKRLPLLWVLLKECRTLFLFMFYLYLVQPYLPDYCSVVWGNSLQCMHFGLSEKPQKLQNRAARILISCSRHSAGENLVIKD